MPGILLLSWTQLAKRGEAAWTADKGEVDRDHDRDRVVTPAIGRLRERRHELPLGLHLALARTGGATVSAVVVAETETPGTEVETETVLV